MNNTSCFIPLCILFGLIVTELNAQDLNDEMKKRLRQSLITPEKQIGGEQHQYAAPQILPGEDREVLKVSPFTKLPTRGDRIQLLNPPEKLEIHIITTVTNAPPIDQRPIGSVRYEFMGKGGMQIISTAGTRPAPSAFDAGPIRKRHKRNANILKALQK